jgi:hypothetical protein
MVNKGTVSHPASFFIIWLLSVALYLGSAYSSVLSKILIYFVPALFGSFICTKPHLMHKYCTYYLKLNEQNLTQRIFLFLYVIYRLSVSSVY